METVAVLGGGTMGTVMCAISAVARRERFIRKPAGDREPVEA